MASSSSSSPAYRKQQQQPTAPHQDCQSQKRNQVYAQNAIDKKRPSYVHFHHSMPKDASLKWTSDHLEDGRPKHLLQVYALGGFLLVRWLWARWRERRARRRFAGRDED